MEELIKEAQEKVIGKLIECTGLTCKHEIGHNHYFVSEEEINRIVSTLLTEARKKWLEEEILKLKKCLSGQKIDYGHDCYDHACRYCENAVIDSTLEDQISRLEAELKALDK